MRAVLDPNVYVSGLLSSEGAPAQVLVAWHFGRFELLVSNLVVAELRRVLGYPKLRTRIPEVEAEAALAWLTENASNVDDPSRKATIRSEDPGDDYLIALAAAERAALVSGDRHLLVLSERIPVYSPRDFLHLVESGEHQYR